MREKTMCCVCGQTEPLQYLGHEKWHCNYCGRDVEVFTKVIMSPYERNRAAVYATGNKWAIENWNATH